MPSSKVETTVAPPTDQSDPPVPQGNPHSKAVEDVKDLHAQITRAIDTLTQAVQAGASDRLQTMLRFSAWFHHYSFGNMLLVACQRPDATRVASYATWKRLGYQVMKGEKGIPIIVPVRYAVRQAVPQRDVQDVARVQADERVESDDEPRVTSRTTFKIGYVFDAAQLDPAGVAAHPFPALFYDLGDDAQAEACSERLLTVVAAHGIVCEAVPRATLGGAEAVSYGGRVRYCADLGSRRRVQALAHEFAHELLHWDQVQRPKRVEECEAEAVAFVVSEALGVSNPFSADYLILNANDAAAVHRQMTRIHATAATILTAFRTPAARAEDPAPGDGR